MILKAAKRPGEELRRRIRDMKTEQGIRRIRVISTLLLLLLLFCFIPGSPLAMTAAKADTVKDASNTTLGTKSIENPYWQGFVEGNSGWFSYVYYGTYNGSPVRYRVLDRNSGDFGVAGGSLLLDCDTVLFDYAFNRSNVPKEGTDRTNDWKYSDIRNLLNSDATLNGMFTGVEKAAIAPSYKAAKAAGDGTGWYCLEFTPLTGEKLFLLDNAEASRTSYGYIDYYGTNLNRQGTGRIKGGGKWLLRSPFYLDGLYYLTKEIAIVDGYQTVPRWRDDDGRIIYHIGFIEPEGRIWGEITTYLRGISPAMNVDLDKILFVTRIDSDKREYKLTLQDDSLSVSIPEGGRISSDGRTIYVPYTVTGEPNRLSLLITDRDYNEASAKIRYYESIDPAGGIGSAGTAAIMLPEDMKGTDRAYLVAERNGGDHYTDYAGLPMEIVLQGYSVTFDANGGSVTPVSGWTDQAGRLRSLPDPARDRYAFTGWFTAAEGGEEITLQTIFASDQTVYAHWVPAHTVTFDANGGDVSPEAGQTNHTGRLLSLPEPAWEKHYFDGWFTAPDGGDKVTEQTVFASDQTIYAHWIQAYDIVFDACDGSSAPLVVRTNRDGRLDLSELPWPEFEGNLFIDWYTEPEGGEEITLSRTYEADRTVYAHWEVTEPVGYIRNGSLQTCSSFRKVSDSNRTWHEGWYVVKENVELDGRVAVRGTVNLILCDGKTLNAPLGIRVAPGNTLKIWRQERGTGTLTSSLIENNNHDAAIGGNSKEDGGTIVIYGGKINTKVKGQGAGIGGGRFGSCGNVTIYGGNISSNAYNGAGIGSGAEADNKRGSITIHGGTISARSDNGAGIGGGMCSSAGTITINGGNITAKSAFTGASIGGGGYSERKMVGGGGGTIVIRGGQIYAERGDSHISIGAGQKSEASEKGTVTLSWTGDDDYIKTGRVYGDITLERSFQIKGNADPEVKANDLYNAKDLVKIVPLKQEAKVSILWDRHDVILVGETITLPSEVRSPGEEEGTWTWSSKKPEIARIDPQTGELTGVSPGTTKITASYDSGDSEGTKTLSITIVDAVSVNTQVENGNVSVDPKDVSPGDTVTLTFTPEGNNTHMSELIAMRGSDYINVTRDSANMYQWTFVMPRGDVNVSASFSEGSNFLVNFVDWDGKLLESVDCPEGSTPEYGQAIPAREADEQYQYVFSGWKPAIIAAREDTVYTAEYTAVPRTYSVSFLGENGEELETAAYEYGQTPAYAGETPVKAAEGNKRYTFSGWEPEIEMVTGDAAYTAVFEESSVIALQTGENALNLVKWKPVECVFTPAETGYFRIWSAGPEILPDLMICDDTGRRFTFDELLFWNLNTDGQNNFEYVVQLEGGKEYRLTLEAARGSGEITLHMDPAAMYQIVYDDGIAHGTVDGPDQVYTGQAFYPDERPDDGYGLLRMTVTDEQGLSLARNEDGNFIMGNSDVFVTCVFVPAYEIQADYGEHVWLNTGFDYIVRNVWTDEGDFKFVAAQGVQPVLSIGTDEGYVLDELTFTTEDGEDMAYDLFRIDMNTYEMSFTMPGETVVLTLGAAPAYTVSFDAGEGTGFMDDEQVIAGQPYTLPECGFTAPAGERFGSWQIGGDDGILKQPGDTITPTGDVTLTSVWWEKPFGTPDFTLPSRLTRIENSAFEGITAKVVYVPDRCRTIGAYAFRNCKSLTQIRIPQECTIGEGAFDGCGTVCVYGVAGSPAESYCADPKHNNCVFVEYYDGGVLAGIE